MGDFKQFDCPRCGLYQITGTGLAMLSTRLAEDERAAARMSHAVRLLSESVANGKWTEITSLNLDELVKKPLPSIQNQQTNLLKWAAKSLGDDQLGTVFLPTEKTLASIIGTLDGDRANKLISLMDEEELIAKGVENRITITVKGWKALQNLGSDYSTFQTAEIKSQLPEEPKLVKAPCNECKGERSAFVRATHTVNGSDGEVSWSDTYDTLECCGCHTISIRHEFWFSEWDQIGQDSIGNMTLEHGVKTRYWPPPILRPKPKWSSQITDPVLRTVFDELYVALDSDLLVLSTIGARTLFDRASFLQVGDPVGGFAEKLQVMLDEGYISANEKIILLVMTDAGNASSHRGYSPSFAQLTSIVDILESYIHRTFILPGAADALRQSIPPRGPKKKRSKSKTKSSL